MKKIETHNPTQEKIEIFKNHTDGIINQLNPNSKEDRKKIIETLHASKLLTFLNSDLEIVGVHEQPDFIITDGNQNFGLEHQQVFDQKSKVKDGFLESLFFDVEELLQEDNSLPNYLIICLIKPFVSFKAKDKPRLREEIIKVIKDYIQTEIIIENQIIEDITLMENSEINIIPNLGGWWQKEISNDMLINAINKKEKIIYKYKANTGDRQWLLLVIGGRGESSLIFSKSVNLNIKSEFEKIYLLEDLYNNLYEIK